MDQLGKRFESLSPKDRINAFIASQSPGDDRLTQRFVKDQVKLKDVKVLGPSTAIGTFTFKVDPYYCNGSGTLHGKSEAL